MTVIRFLLFASIIGVTAATWSLSGYACNQPQMYQQCNCQSFCSPYVQQDPCGGGCGGGEGYQGYHPRRRHRTRHHHKKPRRKFRFESSEEDIDVPPPAPSRKPKPTITSQEEGFIEETSVTRAPSSGSASPKDGSWENEDLWEKKFESKSHGKLDEEEFPDFSSSEMEETAPSRVVTQAPTAGQGIGVNTGLGVGAPGVGGGGLGGGGLGLGNGGLFGISSGVGVGVPGVGPIGVSSGLGIGK